MTIQMQIGLDAISSYKRLAYSPWHAIAEFVDNSTQSYFDNKGLLDQDFSINKNKLEVSIIYDQNEKNGFLRVADNAQGMDEKDLERALHVACPPDNPLGRCRYGMGLKTASCWIGNNWSIRTKKMGDDFEYFVEIDVKAISEGNNVLKNSKIKKDKKLHYTMIEIWNHNRKFQGRTLGKIREFLSSMYRQDFRMGYLDLVWQGEKLKWNEFEDRLLVARDGKKYKEEYSFIVNGKTVTGWVGVLSRGSRADAGFSILHSNRVIKGWPDSWRPSKIYGQIQGSNDLVNQRLIGEIHLDDFEVSHTKDDILWLGDEEELVEKELLVCCANYRDIALKHRKREDDQRGPTDIEISTAIDEFEKEINSPEMVDQISIEEVPSQEVVDTSIKSFSTGVQNSHNPTFVASIESLKLKLYVANDLSPMDYYVASDTTSPNEIVIIINAAHPHWSQLRGSEGVLNYLRDCTYDAVAEWQARKKTARIDPNTIIVLKDKLLRIPFELENFQE